MAIHTNKLWNELKGNNILIHKLYGIGYYPTKMLVGKDGMIIGRFSGTDDEILLDKKLAEIF